MLARDDVILAVARDDVMGILAHGDFVGALARDGDICQPVHSWEQVCIQNPRCQCVSYVSLLLHFMCIGVCL